jgi:hypothetical protein
LHISIAANPQQGYSGAEVKISQFFRSFHHPIPRKLYTNVLTIMLELPVVLKSGATDPAIVQAKMTSMLD